MDVNSPKKDSKDGADEDKKWSSGKKKPKFENKLIKLIPCNSDSNSPEVEQPGSSSDDNTDS